MGRIITAVTVQNYLDSSKTLRCATLVDTGASHLVLPRAWEEQLGDLPTFRLVDIETATQTTVQGRVCGPVKIQIEGFEPISGEVLFVDMEPENGIYEPLLGYIPLEQSQAAVDMLGHRLLRVKHLDAK